MKTQKLMIIITYLLLFLFFGISYAGKYKEIISERTEYSKTFYGGNGQYKTVISLRPIHLETPEGYFKEIDLSSTSDTLSYLNFTGIYKEYINSDSTDISSGDPYVGNVSMNDTTEHRYRSAQYWDVQGISDNVTVDSAKFQLDISYSLSESMTIYLKDLDYIYPGYLNDIYNDCGSGTTLGTLNLPEQSGHYDSTFTGGSSFCQNLKSSLTKDWFGIGFYTSSETDSGKYAQLATLDGYLEVFYYNPYIPFQITVNNDFSGGFYKLIFQGDTTVHTVPDTLYFFHGHGLGLMAVNQDYGNYYRVFDHWIEQPGNNQYSTNPLHITVTQDASYEWKTRRQFEIDLDNEYLNGGSGGYILVNDTSRNVPYTKYVLEDDSVKLEAPSQPIVVNNKTVQYNFQEWSDQSVSNPRLFFPPDHMNLTAKYKGHLVSSSQEATAYNNQRKIVRSYPALNDVFLVYEDAGTIYVSASQDNGNTWGPEIRLSNGAGYNCNPSIAMDNGGNLAVVWENYNYEENKINIMLNRYYNGQGGWGTAINIYYYEVDDFRHPATPVIAALEWRKWMVVWRGISYISQQNSLLYLDVDENSIDWPLILEEESEGSGMAAFPSIGSSLFSVPSTTLYLTYQYWYYIRTIARYSDGYSWNWGEIHDLYFAESGKPQAATDGAHRNHFVWQAGRSSDNSRYIVHQSVDLNGEWSNIYTYYNSAGVSNANITGHLAENNPQTTTGATLFWQDSDNAIFALQNINGIWDDSPTFLSRETIYPNSVKVDRPNYHPYLSSSVQGPPFFVNSSIFEPEGDRQKMSVGQENIIDNELNDGYYRGFHFLNDSLIFTFFELSQISLVSNTHHRSIQFKYRIDNSSSPFPSIESLKFLRTSNFVLNDSITGFSYKVNGWIRNELKFLNGNSLTIKVCLFDSGVDTLITILDSLRFKKNQFHSYTRHIPLHSEMPLNKKVYLKLLLKGIKPVALKNFRSIATNIYHLENEPIDSNVHIFKENRSLSGKKELKIPGNYRLYQNYPNPFNPATTITYDLPEKSQVSLAIYDVTGRLIRVLVDRLMPVGQHRAVWDGSDETGQPVASGVYVYRLTAGSRQVQSRKMLLMK